MLPLCIFCDNESGSEEHLWGAWIHRRVKFGAIRVQEGTDLQLIDDNPERTINTVCHTCNNTWMSRLEEKNIPAVGDMLADKPTVIDAGRQRLLGEWAVKTAIVMDSIKDRHGTRSSIPEMRVSPCAYPKRSQREPAYGSALLTESHLGAFGTDFTILGSDQTRIGTGTANTIIVGYFAVQVVTIPMKPDYAAYDIVGVQPKPRD
jgi:hypothetical protein